MSNYILRDMPLLTEASSRFHQLPDGSMVDVYAVTYDCKVDIVNKKFMRRSDDGYKDCELPTFNDLYANGTMGKEGTCIEKQYSISFQRKYKLNEKDIEKIIKEFKKNGFNVTKEAINHNYDAWCVDFKSGYRDEENNYHLFSPCGCNPLSFRATTLHPKCADWQETYIA